MPRMPKVKIEPKCINDTSLKALEMKAGPSPDIEEGRLIMKCDFRCACEHINTIVGWKGTGDLTCGGCGTVYPAADGYAPLVRK